MKALERRKIKRMGDIEVTFMGFGALEIGRDWGMGADTKRPDEENAGEVLRTVLDSGINLIDTASAYHRSEERIGKCVSDRRNEYILATKCGEYSDEPHTHYDFSYDAIKKSIDRSLIALKTETIDLMQIHFGPNPKEVLDKGETVAAMKDAVKEGKVKYLGASIDGDLATRCIESGDFDVMQMCYNLMNQGNEKNISLANEKGIGVFIRTGLGNGLFTPRVVDNIDRLNQREQAKIKKLLELVGNDTGKLMALALNFLYGNKNISSILLGTKKPEHIKANISLLETDVSADMLDEAKKIVAEVI